MHLCEATTSVAAHLQRQTRCRLTYLTFPQCQYPAEFTEEPGKAPPRQKLLTAFRIITFFPPPVCDWEPKTGRRGVSVFSQSQKLFAALCSANHTTVGHVHSFFGRSIYLHFLLMSSTLPKNPPERIDGAHTKKKERKTNFK